ALGAVLKNGVSGEQRFVILKAGLQPFEERPAAAHPVLGEIGHHAADADVVVGHAGAAYFFKKVQYFFALAEGVEKRGISADIDAVGAEENEVGSDAVQLHHDHAQRVAALGDLDLQKFFHGQAPNQVVGHGGQIVPAVGDHQHLRVS